MLMTTWMVPATVDSMACATINAGITAEDVHVQAIAQATPLAWSKQAIKGKVKTDSMKYQIRSAIIGETGGCLGETSAVALLLGGIYLLIRKTISAHIPLAVLISATVFAAVGYYKNPDAYMLPSIHIASGGMMLCAFFIATDPVTAPLTRKGMWIFGIGTGSLIMLIRMVGEYPEGVMYAILLMNAVTPLIDRFCKLIPAGGKINV